MRTLRESSTRNLAIGAVILAGVLAVLVLVSSFGPAQRPGDTSPPQDSIPIDVGSPPPTSVALVDQSLRELDWGSIAFNASASMRYAQAQTVELLLSPSASLEDLQAQLEQKAGADSARVRVSNRMAAQLTGTGFQVAPLTPELQAITSQQMTRWTWEVTPTTHGQQTLHLALSALLDVAGRDAPLVVRTFDREIQVDITVPQRVSGFVQKNWQWLWAAVVVPFAGYAWNRKKKKKGRAKTQSAIF